LKQTGFGVDQMDRIDKMDKTFIETAAVCRQNQLMHLHLRDIVRLPGRGWKDVWENHLFFKNQ